MPWAKNRELFPYSLGAVAAIDWGMETNQGLYVSVMGDDCTNGGVTSGQREAFLRVPGGSHGGPGEQSSTPVLELLVEMGADPEDWKPGRCVMARANFVAAMGGGRCPSLCRVRAVPVGADPRKLRFGGHWVWSSDARFPFESPIPVFDRVE